MSQKNRATLNLKEILSDLILAEISRQTVSSTMSLTREEVMGLLEVPPDSALGDYAFPCFRLSKALRRGPAIVAKEFAAALATSSLAISVIEKVQATGPYINFFLSYEKIAAEILPQVFSGGLFQQPTARQTLPKTMIEFSQPNTHKAFHVGHCRNVALGDAIVRMNRYVGYEVVAANYIGDDGAHIAKCLWYMNGFSADTPPKPGEGDRGEWLGSMYTAATQKLEDADPETKQKFLKDISDIQKRIESKDPEITSLWAETKKWSMDSFLEIYQWLDVRFDHYFYESEVLDESRQIVKEGLEQGLFIRSEGAVGLDLTSDNLGFFMLLKSDGTTLYSTRDLALARRKFKDFAICRSLYVVASEQELHFRQVFKTLEKMGFTEVKNSFHLSYGLVVLPEGKMSSRVGNVIYFSALRAQLMSHILNDVFKALDVSGWSEDEKQATAKKIAISAIKYGMIASDPKKTIVFDIKKWLALNGDTGPYLLYSFVRMRSILRKAGVEVSALAQGFAQLDHTIFNLPDEKALLKRILGLNDTVARAVRDHSPAVLAGFLFELCQEFNTFYVKTPILKQELAMRRDCYLAFLAALSTVLAKGCELLGIEVPERM